jgi:aminoglycoside phosphotransferase (APT) family kinase protein
MASRTETFSGTMAVREQHRFDAARLEAYLQRNIEDFAGPLTVEQFKGGQSNPTYRLSAGARKYVLRRKPPGKLLPSAHAVDREYKVIKALYGTKVPVPRPYLLCEDDSVIGTAFYVMECVEGRVLWDLTLPGMTPAERRAIYDAANEVQANLHLVDYKARGLEEFGRPGNYFSRQISRWTKQYKASETEHVEAMEKLIAWLPENIPPEQGTSVVHGDYRLDNMIFHPTEAKVLAVLDWELCTLGDPIGDFSYTCMSWRLDPSVFNGLGNVDFKGLGIPTEEEYVAAYCKRTGRSEIPHWEFYMAYNMFRLAGILQGIMGRHKDGTASSEHAARMGAMARPVAEQGWRQAQLMGAT